MATVEGLNLRGARYYLRVLIPEDLQAAYGGKTRVNLSLRTSDRATAVLHGLRAKPQWFEAFTAKRKLQPHTQTRSTTADALLAQGDYIHLASTSSTLEPLCDEGASIPYTAHKTPSQSHSTGLSMSGFALLNKPSSRMTESHGMSLWEVYEFLKKAERRSKDTVQVYARTLGMAEKCFGSLPSLSQITRAQRSTFKAWLQDPSQELSPKTAKHYFTNL